MKTYNELKDLPGYERLCETSYNTLAFVVDKVIPQAEKLGLRCKMDTYGGLEFKSKRQVKNHKCNTTVCIMGIIGTIMPVKDGYFDKTSRYSHRLLQEDIIPLLYSSRMWYFIFSAVWGTGFEEGVARIKVVINGEYYEDWSYEDRFCKS